MRLRRRRPSSTTPDATPSTEVAVRAERVVLALAVYTQQLDDRLERLERRVTEREEAAAIDVPTHDDVLEVRLHSARVAAELSRMAVELRAEIDELATRKAPVSLTDQQLRAFTLADSILDLSDRLDTAPVDLTGTPGDWAATA